MGQLLPPYLRGPLHTVSFHYFGKGEAASQHQLLQQCLSILLLLSLPCVANQGSSSSGKWASDLLVAFLSLEGKVSTWVCLWYPRWGSQCTESLQKRWHLFWWHHPFWWWGPTLSLAEFPLQVVIPECTLELCQGKSRRWHWRNVLVCMRPAFPWCPMLYQNRDILWSCWASACS